MKIQRFTHFPGASPVEIEELTGIIENLKRNHKWLSSIPIRNLIDFFDDFGNRLIKDSRTRAFEGMMFLSSWLRRNNLEKVLEMNLNGNLDYLDGFVPSGQSYIAAKPHGFVSMWMAGNVATLPLFSTVPSLLAKNVNLVKLATPYQEGIKEVLEVFADSEGGAISGKDLLKAIEIVYFDYNEKDINEQMSLAADCKVIWGGKDAIKGITVLPRKEHCPEIIFGPKYSIGIIGRKRIEKEEGFDDVVNAFVRDIAVFDQRACSSPQTIFVEQNSRLSLRQIAEKFAVHFTKLVSKPGLDPYTTIQIVNARASWALNPKRDVIASLDGANWTICMDREIRFKESVQSRTIFLTEIKSWKQIIPLISHKIQTIGVAFLNKEDALCFSDKATLHGTVRCVRPGLMNLYESPWDGKFFISQLVRWVTAKP